MRKERDSHLNSRFIPAELISEAYGDQPKTIFEGLDVIPFGIEPIDRSLKIGGAPRGYVTHITGDSYAGKSVLTWHLVGQCTREGGSAVIIDADRTIDLTYLCKVAAIPFEALTIVKMSNIKAIGELIKDLTEQGVDLVVVDSLAAIKEATGFSKEELYIIPDAIRNTQTAAIITNQYRYHRGRLRPMYCEQMHDIAHVQMCIRMRESIFKAGVIIGHYVDISVRNRFCVCGEDCSLRLIYGDGIDVQDANLEIRIEEMLQSGIVQRDGSWYKYEGESYHGKEALKERINNGFQPTSQPHDILSK